MESCSSLSLLRSLILGCHLTFPQRNGCSHSNHIPFPNLSQSQLQFHFWNCIAPKFVTTICPIQGRSQEETTTEAKDPEISRMKSSNIISLMRKKKRHLVKVYRGECHGSPHNGYGPALILHFLSSLDFPEDHKIKIAAFDEAFLEALSTFKSQIYQILAIQKSIVENLNISVNLPTGSGKSLLDQALPILFDGVFKERGHIVVVASPLISLREDQIKKLRRLPGGGGGTAIYGSYRYVPLWRVCFSSSLL